MYDELIAELRQHHCDAKEDDTQEVCEECSYDVIIVDKSAPSGFASVCVCGLMNRAADAIEAFEIKAEVFKAAYIAEHNARIDEIKRHMWIPVTERLPSENDRYLTVSIEPWFGTTVVDTMRWSGVWMYDGRQTEATVTHWMPLPEPPKDDEEQAKEESEQIYKAYDSKAVKTGIKAFPEPPTAEEGET